MKGQFIFEFLIAGLIFFTIVLYTISYLNMNVSDFRGKFYQSRLQSKAVQISKVLMSGESPLGLVDDSEFSQVKIQNFNNTYCTLGEKYKNLVDYLYLYEKTVHGFFPNDIKIHLSKPGETLLDCGPMIPMGITKGDVGRVGIFEGETVKLNIVVW
ncbi:MAG: hypothetical protein V3U72_02150 [Candidatus Aenigmarchaeota archaeon]